MMGDLLSVVLAVAIVDRDAERPLAFRAKRHVPIQCDGLAKRRKRVARADDLAAVRGCVAEADDASALCVFHGYSLCGSWLVCLAAFEIVRRRPRRRREADCCRR